MNRGIDHLVLCVSDLDRAVARYRQLGFTTTPRAEHPWGTDNSLVQLDGCFLELLTVARPERIEPGDDRRFSFGAFNRDFLARREGMSMLVFESGDARADREVLAARGLPPWEPFDFERRATLPDGSKVRVAFSLAFATDPRMPHAAFFYCQQHAPQYFWKPDYQRHANGARTITKVVMSAPQPEALRDFFSKVQEPGNVSVDADGLTVSTPRGRILVLAPDDARRWLESPAETFDAASPSFVGFSVRVPALGPLAEILDSNAVPFVAAPQAIRIPPEHAFGAGIEFTAET